MEDRTRLRVKLDALKARRTELLVGVHQHDGAIAVLEELLAAPDAEPTTKPTQEPIT